MRANENAVQANAHMDEANELQRKSRKRTICIVMSLLVLVIMAVGTTLMTGPLLNLMPLALQNRQPHAA